MALFDFLKRKKQIEKTEKARRGEWSKKGVEKQPKKVSAGKKSAEDNEVITASRPAGRSKKSSGFSYQAINQPHISEKAAGLAGHKNQYTFKTLPSYNKKEIKKSVEGIYGVDVLSVNIIKIPAKKRRLGKTQGFRKGYTKAVVKIKEGQKIEIL